MSWRWLLAGAVLLPVLVALGIPPGQAVRVPVGPPQRVAAITSKVGVHMRLTDEVDAWKIKHSFEMAREMGATWAVEYFPWPYIEGEAKGVYNWEHADLVVAHAKAQGLTLIARLDGVPRWARPEESTWRSIEPDHYDDFAAFVYAFVRRYRGLLRHYIIWNEPNLSLEWGGRPPDPAGYTELLRRAYRRAKEADPDCVILAAGLSPTLEGYGSDWGLNELVYLQAMYDAGARDCFDALAIHAYGWTSAVDEPADPQRINFARAQLIRDVMLRNGDGHKPCFITEGGWNDHPRWVMAVSPARRVMNTLGAYRLVEQWEWCRAFCVWCFRLPVRARNFNDYYTLVTVDFTPKPLYLELQKYARGW